MPIEEVGTIVDVSPAPVESNPTPIATETSTSVVSSASTPTSASSTGTEVVSAGTAEPSAEEWRQHLSKTYGLDATGFASPSQAIDYSMQAYITAAQERERLQSDYQQRLAAYEQQLAVYQNLAGQRGAPEPEPAKPEPGTWAPPEYDPKWSRFLQMNPQTGLYEEIVPGTINPDIVAKANARAEWERQWQSEFAQNPYEFMKKGMQDEFKRIKEEAYQEAVKYFESYQQKTQLNQQVDSTVKAHSDWLYQKNAMGDIGRDAYGQPLLTEKGAQYVNAVQTLLQSGVTDPATQDKLALMMIGHTGQPAQPTPASRVEQFVGKPAARNLAEALHTSNRNGSDQPVVAGAIGETATPGSFLAMAAGPMRERGIALTGGNVTPI